MSIALFVMKDGETHLLSGIVINRMLVTCCHTVIDSSHVIINKIKYKSNKFSFFRELDIAIMEYPNNNSVMYREHMSLSPSLVTVKYMDYINEKETETTLNTHITGFSIYNSIPVYTLDNQNMSPDMWQGKSGGACYSNDTLIGIISNYLINLDKIVVIPVFYILKTIELKCNYTSKLDFKNIMKFTSEITGKVRYGYYNAPTQQCIISIDNKEFNEKGMILNNRTDQYETPLAYILFKNKIKYNWIKANDPTESVKSTETNTVKITIK